MRGIGAENAVANGPASRTRSKSKGAASGGGRASAAKPAAVPPRAGAKPPQQQAPPEALQQAAVSPKLVPATLPSPPATVHQGSEAVAGVEPEPRLQEEACVGQLRALLGSYDQLPPGDLKFLVVMRKVAAIWAPGEWAVDTVVDAHEALLKLLARFEEGKLAPWEGTPVARRAMLQYVQSAMA